MVAPTVDDDAMLARLFEGVGAAETARRTGMTIRRVYARRATLEARLGRELVSPNRNGRVTRTGATHPGRLNLDVQNGVVLIGSDWHIWPGPASLMHRAFVHFCKELQPKAVIANGDVVDLGAISRHPPINWERLPTVQEEIEAAQARLAEIEKAAFKAKKFWALGNHDSRYAVRLATVAPEYAKIAGVHLRDHFPNWESCWSVEINGDVIVKHRQANGVHAPYNNALKSGRSMVTGHLHSAQVKPWTDYNGTRFGVDTGCVADTSGKQFEYMEDGYRNWISGFGVFTFRKGVLLWPELVTKFDDRSVQFRGEVIRV